jgi:hypothetical protein
MSGEKLLKRQMKICSIPKVGISLAVREEHKHQVAYKNNHKIFASRNCRLFPSGKLTLSQLEIYWIHYN